MGEGTEAPEQLLGNPRNWRVHPVEQQKALSGVLNSVGIVDQVIVNQRTGFVLDGHLRVSLAISEGVPEIPVTYVDLSDEEEAVVLSTFDSIAGMAGTDSEKLGELIAEARESEVAVSEDLAGLLDSLKPSGGEKTSGKDVGAGEREVCSECGQTIRGER